MSERRVSLTLAQADLGSTAFGRQNEPSSSFPAANNADDEARFAAALADGASPTMVPSDPGLPQPFALFGAAVSLSASPLQKHAVQWLEEGLSPMVEQLLVGEGLNGRQVRLALTEDQLPGVTITIDECEGRLQVSFICDVERSRSTLVEALPEMATTLALRLQREVLMRIQTDDVEDPYRVDYLARA